MKNFYFLLLFILFYVFVLSSCGKEEFAENDETDNTIFMSIRPDGVIDGGTLPEVTVTGNYINPSDGGWWYPPFPNEPAGPPSPPPLPTIVGGGGGGTSPGKPLPTVKLTKDLVTLFPGGTTLSKADLEKLNSEFKRMMVHCEYEALNQFLKDNGYCAGKIQMNPPNVQGLVSIDLYTGNLNFYGNDAINAEHLCHEWIHLCQRGINWRSLDFELEDVEGMMEFELVVFQDVIHYMTHGTFERLQPETDFPAAQQWISNLSVSEERKTALKIIYGLWFVTTFNVNANPQEARRIPEIIRDIKTLNVLANDFFKYSSNYKNSNFELNNRYNYPALSSLLNVVNKHCFK